MAPVVPRIADEPITGRPVEDEPITGGSVEDEH